MGNQVKEIRKVLKEELGYNARQVSVKEDRGGLSWSFTLTIRDASVNLNKVEELAENFVSVDRCERSGEILSGGNTYVHVRVSEEVKEQWSEKYLSEVEKAAAEIKSGENSADVLDGVVLIKSARIKDTVDVVRFSGIGAGSTISRSLSLNYLPNISLNIYKSLAF